MTLLIIYILIFFATLIGVELIRRLSIKKDFLDVPNDRSSHKAPTPTGGGIPIVIFSLISFGLYQFIYMSDFIWSYIIGAILIAFISWFDDIFSLSPFVRFVCHFAAAFIVIYQLGFWNIIYIPIIGNLHISIFGLILTALWIVWLTNAYNFMDGIDGLAGIQAFTATIGWVLIGWIWSIDLYIYFGLVLFVTNLAFLIRNWHPAKIFMGDVGSAFYGFTFAVFPMLGVFETNYADIKSTLPLVAICFLWLFLFDTLVTLLKRIIKKEKVWKAHRQHIYQILIIEGSSHTFVSSLYGILSMFITFGVIYFYVLHNFEILLITLIIMITTILLYIVKAKKS